MFKIFFLFFFFLFVEEGRSSELIIYTSRKEHLVRDIFKQYQRLTGIQIKYKTGPAKSLIQILKAEGENSPADLFMAVDAGNLWFAMNEGLFERVNSPILKSNISPHLRDRRDHWFGLSQRARTIVYHSQRLNSTKLSSYEDLALPKWKEKLCLRTSKKVYNRSLVAMLIYELGEARALEVVKGWAKNATEIFSSDTAVLKAIESGQCDLGIVNTYYYGRFLRQFPKSFLKLFWPNQQKGSFGVHVNISGAGVLKTSRRKKQAIRFLEWLSGIEAQKSFAQINFEYATHPQVRQAPEVEMWGDFMANTRFPLDQAGRLQKKAIKLMRKANYL